MKKVVKVAGVAAVAVCVIGVAACGAPEQLAIGREYVSATSQLDALVKLDTGYADVAVIDSVMAGYYMTTGEYANKMQMVDNLVLATESYGIAAKKGNETLVSKINQGLKLTYVSGVYQDIADEYGVTESLSLTGNEIDAYASASDNSWNSVVSNGNLVIGYTVFAPIAYTETGSSVLKGFDIDLARAVVAALNLTYETNIQVEFMRIDWNAKETLLDNGTIHLVWNGMTITEGRKNTMTISVPYLYNKQVAVIMKEDADKYTTIDSMKNAVMTAEKGSAGETIIKG